MVNVQVLSVEPSMAIIAGEASLIVPLFDDLGNVLIGDASTPHSRFAGNVYRPKVCAVPVRVVSLIVPRGFGPDFGVVLEIIMGFLTDSYFVLRIINLFVIPMHVLAYPISVCRSVGFALFRNLKLVFIIILLVLLPAPLSMFPIVFSP